MSVYEVIRLASNFSCIVPLVIYFKRMANAEKHIHIIGCVMLISGLADLITFIKPDGLNVALIFNLQDILQFLLITSFYYVVEFDRKLISWGVTFYLTTLIAVSLWSQNPFAHQTLMWTISALIIILLSIGYLVHLYQYSPVKTSSIYSTLWINGSLLFYFCFSLWLFIMGDYILNELPERIKMVYWSCHNANNILKNILIGVGIWSSRI